MHLDGGTALGDCLDLKQQSTDSWLLLLLSPLCFPMLLVPLTAFPMLTHLLLLGTRIAYRPIHLFHLHSKMDTESTSATKLLISSSGQGVLI